MNKRQNHTLPTNIAVLYALMLAQLGVPIIDVIRETQRLSVGEFRMPDNKLLTLCHGILDKKMTITGPRIEK